MHVIPLVYKERSKPDAPGICLVAKTPEEGAYLANIAAYLEREKIAHCFKADDGDMMLTFKCVVEKKR